MRISASSIWLRSICKASGVLPARIGADTEATKKGREVHAIMEVGIVDETRARQAAPERYDEFVEKMDWPRLRRLFGGVPRTEVAVIYNARSRKARIVDVKGRDYPLQDAYDVPGRTDVVNVVDGMVIHADYKTGHSDLPPVKDSPQLQFHSVAHCSVDRLDAAKGMYIRLADDGRFFVSSGKFDAFDLMVAADSLEQLMDGLAENQRRLRDGEWPEMVTGPQCAYCDCFAHCPANMMLVQQMLAQPLPVPVGHEQVGQVWSMLSRVKAILAQAEQLARDWVERNGSVTLESGQVLGIHEQSWPTVKSSDLAVMLREELGEQAVDAVAKLSKGSVRQACEAHVRAERGLTRLDAVGREEVNRLEAKLLARAEAAGAIVAGTREVFSAVAPAIAAARDGKNDGA